MVAADFLTRIKRASRASLVMGMVRASRALVLLLCVAGAQEALACSSAGVILDAETDALLRNYSEPMLEVSGLVPGSAEVVLSGIDQINAYASPGCVTIYSGLLFEADNPSELRGVIAHEIGHLAGGHITALKQQIEEYTLISLASTILGLGMLAAGLPDAGMLVIAGGSGVGIGRFLQHSRTQESAADNAALSYLERTGNSGRGIIDFFRKLAAIEGDYDINPYMSTHPLSQARISYLEQRVEASPYANKPPSTADTLAFDMLQAKIFAFFRPPEQTMRRYLEGSSIPARYAHAVMHTRTRNYNQALTLMDALIADIPGNPFLHEWHGYILTNAGRPEEAIASYERALELAPDNLILHLEIGLALTAVEDDQKLIRRGMEHLRRAVSKGGQTAALAWRRIARAQGNLGQRALAELATAESAYYRNSYFEAITHAGRARRILPETDQQSHLRALDIHIVSCNLLKQQKDLLPKEQVESWRALCTVAGPESRRRG